jgi:hypothetical protein
VTRVIVKTLKRQAALIFRVLSITFILSALSFHVNARVFLFRQHNPASAGYTNPPESPLVIALALVKIDDGIAQLTWTSQPGIFELIRTDPSGIPTIIYTGTDLTYTDIITSPYCGNTSLSYSVQLAGVSGSSSNTVSGIFIDHNKPADPLLDSISVDSQGHPVITWIPSSSADVTAYRINTKKPDTSWPELITVPGRSTSSYTAYSLSACTDILTFNVNAKDLCENYSTSMDGYDHPLSTMKIEQPAVNYCDRTAVLTWNKYLTMNPALREYQVYRQEGSAPYALLGTTSPGVTTYTDRTGFKVGLDYLYYVRAVSQYPVKSSSSCKIGFTFSNPPEPDTLSLDYVSVTGEHQVSMGIYFGPPETVGTIQVLRSETADGPFDTIASIPRKDLGDIVDSSAHVNQGSYYYKIDVLDPCGEFVRASERARTVFLSCRTNSDESHALTWNPYEGWRGGVDHYEVNRLVNDIADAANPIASTVSATYTDFLPPSLSGENIISYFVTAIEADVATPDKSVSNTVQAIRQPQVLMPNAFVPRGIKNNRFRPVMDYFVDEGNYQLLVYNKWWQLVFISTDKSIGWDGKFNGEYAPGGIYYYSLKYNSLTGGSFTKTGLLLLVE